MNERAKSAIESTKRTTEGDSNCLASKVTHAQVAAMREALEYCDEFHCGHDRPCFDSPVKTREALSSDAGKRHLELDILKDKVVEASKYYELSCRERFDNCAEALRQLRQALSALEAKEKEMTQGKMF